MAIDDRPMICGLFKYEIGRLIGRSSADHRPMAKTLKLSADGEKNYNKVVIIYFLSADEKKAKTWHFRPTVGGANVIAV